MAGQARIVTAGSHSNDQIPLPPPSPFQIIRSSARRRSLGRAFRVRPLSRPTPGPEPHSLPCQGLHARRRPKYRGTRSRRRPNSVWPFPASSRRMPPRCRAWSRNFSRTSRKRPDSTRWNAAVINGFGGIFSFLLQNVVGVWAQFRRIAGDQLSPTLEPDRVRGVVCTVRKCSTLQWNQMFTLVDAFVGLTIPNCNKEGLHP